MSPSSSPEEMKPRQTVPPDFNELCLHGTREDAPTDNKSRLWSALFSLEQWHFIARGEFPDMTPYVAANKAIANGEYLMKAFTDTKRLGVYAKECGLTQPDGQVMILSLPVATILPVMASYVEMGVWGIHFNGDSESEGVFSPMGNLPAIRNYLAANGWL
jgi:hypothetical protein